MRVLYLHIIRTSVAIWANLNDGQAEMEAEKERNESVRSFRKRDCERKRKGEIGKGKKERT